MSTATEELLEPIAAELQEFERRLHESIAADLGPMASAMELIVRAGGKRLRPALVILSSRLGEAKQDFVFDLAMGIEFIHTATLVHDDLIDSSPTRRGITTIHEQFGPNPAIIIGDYYFAKGANLLAAIGEPRIDAAISNAVMTICMGELLQMTSRNDYDQSLDDYYRKIGRKTATLVSTCCYCGGVLSGLGDDDVEALRRYGYELGMAFQIADDVLDYIASSDEVGKPVGADLRQGTVTLPLMLALEDPQTAPRLRAVLDQRSLSDSDYDIVVNLVRGSVAIEDAEQHANDFGSRARAELAHFDDSVARQALARICDYVVERRM
ncbi:MAG: polyprenyl synthetase family protein [Candidatus Dormibacteraeota bacterium]|nr:polyprenyl synthetase family protein [Candidatus Dormibacteraeota bacterium]